MFKAKQREQGGDWVILEIDASVLWTHKCRFCWTNAAASEITRHRGFLGGPWAFERMFADRHVGHGSFRETIRLADFLPTDEQAEVQVFDPIEPRLIVDITVKNQGVKERVESIMHEIGEVRPVAINREIFL